MIPHKLNSQSVNFLLSLQKSALLTKMSAYTSLFRSPLHSGRLLRAVHSVLPLGSVSLTKGLSGAMTCTTKKKKINVLYLKRVFPAWLS